MNWTKGPTEFLKFSREGDIKVTEVVIHTNKALLIYLNLLRLETDPAATWCTNSGMKQQGSMAGLKHPSAVYSL